MVEKKEPNQTPASLVFLTLDGWDVSWNQNPLFKKAEFPNLKNLISTYPFSYLQITNNQEALQKISDLSEIGYYEIGSGQEIFTPLNFIDKSIKNKSFFRNKNLLETLENVKKNNSQLHLLGLASNALIHSSLYHLENLLILAKKNQVNKVYLHIILDGKDEDDHQGIKFIKQVEDIILKYQLGEIASIHGRVYAMDRDNQWNRIAKSYQALVLGQGKLAKNAKKIIQESYNKEIYDQEFLPTVITKNEKPISVIQEGDSLIFFNVEKDATRELTESFVRDDFEKFSPRKYIKNLFFLSFSDHGEEFPVKTIYSKKSTLPSLSEFLIAQNWSQLKISGSRKYPHLNYFFNNKKEFDSKLETKKIITSTKLEEIAKQKEITEKIGEEIIKEIKLKSYNFILANLANFDCLPTEKLEQKNQEEILEYLETVDFQIEKIITSALNKNYLIVITSTSNLSKKEGQKPYPVPLLMIQSNWEGQNLGWKDFSQTETNSNQAIGNLNQVYPTILKALNLSTAHNKLNKPLF